MIDSLNLLILLLQLRMKVFELDLILNDHEDPHHYFPQKSGLHVNLGDLIRVQQRRNLK
jgi:hypothetical protein